MSNINREEIVRRYEQGERDIDLADEFGISRHTVRGWASKARGVAEEPEALASVVKTRRCMNKNCIRRFVPVNSEHWYHEPACRQSESLWTRQEILEEEGDLFPGSSPFEIAKRMAGQKNQLARRLTTVMSAREYLREVVADLADSNPAHRYEPLRVPLREVGDRSEREVVVVCSDWQLGKLEQGIGVEAMLTQRIPRIKEAVHQIVNHYRGAGNPVNRLHLVFAGDMIEGCYIYGGQQISGLDKTSNLHHLAEQVHLAAKLEAELALDFASYVPEVRVTSVPGNHGRTNGKADHSDPEDNWDTAACEWAKDKASNQPNISWQIAKAWWSSFESLGHVVVAIHGDQWRGPFNQVEKLLPQWVLGGHLPRPSLFITAHRHTFQVTTVNGVLVVQNGTIDGGSTYFTKATGVSSQPEQTVIAMSRERGVDAVWPVYF